MVQVECVVSMTDVEGTRCMRSSAHACDKKRQLG